MLLDNGFYLLYHFYKLLSHYAAGLFSFKNCQLMCVTDSLYRRSGRAKRNPTFIDFGYHVGFRFALPIGVKLRELSWTYESFRILMVIGIVCSLVP